MAARKILLKTIKLSADIFKKVLDGLILEPAIRSGDTVQRIPCFDSCQLIVTRICIWVPKLARKCEIKHWLPCGADGRSVFSLFGVRPRDHQIFLLTHGAPLIIIIKRG